MLNQKYIVRKRAMGDALWIEPIVRTLSSQYKKIIVYTKFPELFYNFPYKNVIFRYNLSFFEKCLVHLEKLLGTKIFTYNLDGAYEKRPQIHFLNAYQEFVGLVKTREYPRLYLSDKEKKDPPQIEGKYIVLHLESFSKKKYRSIVGVDWSKIVESFTNSGFKVIQVGINNTNKIPGTINVKTSLRDLIKLLYHSNGFIGIDSGPSHLAASLYKPVIILFGAINPDLRHFPEKLNGLIVKQVCGVNCTTFEVKKEKHHYCSQIGPSGYPKCCIFTTEAISSYVNLLFSQANNNLNNL